MADRLIGRVCVVTGSARGIGATLAQALANEGASVAIADVIDGASVADEITQGGGRAVYVRTDVSDEASVAAMVGRAEAALGPIDVLVNNAAIFASLTRGPFTEIERDAWDAVMAVNVRGPFLCAKAVAPGMMARGTGRIVNIASGTVFKGMVGMLHYVTSKGAVVAMTKCLARELGGHGIGVNAIAPGLTMSEAVVANPTWQGGASANTVASRALRREQLPQDLVGALLFLATADSAFVTGQTIVVDGGAVMN